MLRRGNDVALEHGVQLFLRNVAPLAPVVLIQLVEVRRLLFSELRIGVDFIYRHLADALLVGGGKAFLLLAALVRPNPGQPLLLPPRPEPLHQLIDGLLSPVNLRLGGYRASELPRVLRQQVRGALYQRLAKQGVPLGDRGDTRRLQPGDILVDGGLHHLLVGPDVLRADSRGPLYGRRLERPLIHRVAHRHLHPGIEGGLEHLSPVLVDLRRLEVAGLFPEGDAGPLRHGAKRLLLRVIVQSGLDLTHKPVKVRVRLLSHALGKTEFSRVHDAFFRVVHVSGQALHELIVRLHRTCGVPLVLAALHDLSGLLNRLSKPAPGPGNLYARRGTIDVVLPISLREAVILYLRSVSFHTGHLHVL